MGLDVGGYAKSPDWPKLGPPLFIVTALIVAIQTARWAPRADKTTSERELDREIEFARHVADRAPAHLMRNHESIFPQWKEPW